MSSSQLREQYASDGGSKRPFLPAAIAAAAVPGVVAAWLMSLCFNWGYYLPIIGPAFAGAVVGAALAKAVTRTHCRNRWLAGIVGGVMGVITYLGYYQFSLAHAVPQAAWRVDVLAPIHHVPPT